MRTVRPESRRYLPAKGADSLHRLSLDPLFAMVPFIPLPDPKSAWAILCPAGCDTELIILPEYTGAWLECPTCGFRFIGPHPAQPQLVAKARAAAARARADETRMAGALAALARRGEASSDPFEPAETKPPAAAEKELPPQDLTPDQSKAMEALQVLEKASRPAVPAAPWPESRRQIIAEVKAAPKEPLRPGARPPVVPKGPPAAERRLGVARPLPPAGPLARCDLPAQDLTPEESKALGALETLAKAKGPPTGPREPSAAEPPASKVQPVSELTPDQSRALDALVMMAMATPPPAAPPSRPARSMKNGNRRAQQRLGLGPEVCGKRAGAAQRPAQGGPPAAGEVGAAPRRAGHGDLVLTWVVSLVIAAAIIVAAFACGLPDLALGSVVFVGLAVVRTWLAFRPPQDDLPL